METLNAMYMLTPPVRWFLPLSFCLLFMFSSCKTEEDNSDNPFAGVKNEEPKNTAPIDSASLDGLHKTVFAVSCATPSCHDGSFEPDFRTVSSTFNTLVWHSTIKPDPDTVRNLRTRVVPFQPDSSWLWERLTTNDTINLGRMPSNGTRLSQSQLNNVRKWIEAGAPDAYGQVVRPPNIPPIVQWYLAYDEDSTELHAVTNRIDGWASPFGVPKGRTIRFWVRVVDDSTDIKDLRNNQLSISQERSDFSNATTLDGKYIKTWAGFWTFEISTVNLEKNKPYYFRYYTKDPSQSKRTEYPNNPDPFWLKDHYSFIVY